MSDEESIDDPWLREEQQRLVRLRRGSKAQGRIFTAGLLGWRKTDGEEENEETEDAGQILIGGPNGGKTILWEWANGLRKKKMLAIALSGTGAAAVLAVGVISSPEVQGGINASFRRTRSAFSTFGSDAGNVVAGVKNKVGIGLSSASSGAVTSMTTALQLVGDIWLPIGDGLRDVGGGIATIASSSKEATKVAMFGSPVLLDCFQDSPGATDDLDGASPNHWSLKTAPAIKAHWNVKSACGDASSIPKSCPNHARCAGGLVIDCQATDKTGLFVVSKETYADCVLSPKGKAIADSIQEKIIELVVLHQCKGVKEGYPIDHVVEDGGSIAFAIDGLVKAFAKDPGTADISRHTFELVMPYLNKDVVDAKRVPVSGTSELYVGLTAKFVEEELGQHLPLPCWFPKVVFGFAVTAVGLWWAAVTLCAKCAWEYPKFILSIFVVWLFVKKVCECIEKFVTMPIAVYIIDGWVKERLNPLPVGESLCKAILRDEIGAEYFRFRGHRYLIGTRDWFYDRAWGAFEEEFDDSRFNTEYLETEGFEVPMAHWVRV